MRAFVVDDEEPAREELQWLLEQCEGIELAGEAASADEAREALFSLEPPPELLLLDIDMPGVDGLRLAETLDELEPSPLTIFVTAYEEYAVEAFGVDAVDYLMKPVRLERLQKAVDRAQNRRMQRTEAEPDSDVEPIRRLSVRDGDGYRVVDTEDIYYFESEEGEVYVVSEEGRDPSDFSLKSLESKLDSEEFFRSHRSYLVRLDAIENIEPRGGGTYRLELSASDEDSRGDVFEVPLARSRAEAFERRIPWSTEALEQR